jgi:hypothetical protein
MMGKERGLSGVWLGYDTHTPLVPTATHQVPFTEPLRRLVFYNSLEEKYLYFLFYYLGS